MNTSLNLMKKSIHQATFLIFAILFIIIIIIIIIITIIIVIIIIISAKSLGWWEAKFVCLH